MNSILEESKFIHLWYLAETLKYCNQMPLTPSHQAEFEQVSPYVDVEDLDEEKVEVESLQCCPGEGGQQGPVQRETQ